MTGDGWFPISKTPTQVMSASVTESDWKQFRKVHKTLLQRHCQQTLARIGKLASAECEDAHERYGEIYEYLMKRDRELAMAFNDCRRSTAFHQLAMMRRIGLLTDADLAGFSEELQGRVRHNHPL
jgi:hypothetical protein